MASISSCMAQRQLASAFASAKELGSSEARRCSSSYSSSGCSTAAGPAASRFCKVRNRTRAASSCASSILAYLDGSVTNSTPEGTVDCSEPDAGVDGKPANPAEEALPATEAGESGAGDDGEPGASSALPSSGAGASGCITKC